VNEYHFLVKGSASEPYEVWISKKGSNLTATCTCAAGKNGTYCKHRFRLLQGDDTGVIDGDITKISELPSLLVGTDVEKAMTQVAEAELEYEMAKKKVSTSKKALARVLAN